MYKGEQGAPVDKGYLYPLSKDDTVYGTYGKDQGDCFGKNKDIPEISEDAQGHGREERRDDGRDVGPHLEWQIIPHVKISASEAEILIIRWLSIVRVVRDGYRFSA